jgi:NADH:ubiquinone oxidoreductase subunit 5 (subunit L)/multisubunit Na+/H+ antiporter MnhA subunit
MGGIVKILPLTYVMMLAGSLSLMGFPYLTGFYSKDAILEFTFAANTSFSLFAYLLGILSAFFTAFYSWRLLHLTFFANKTNTLKSAILTAHESPRYMLFAFFSTYVWKYLLRLFNQGYVHWFRFWFLTNFNLCIATKSSFYRCWISSNYY